MSRYLTSIPTERTDMGYMDLRLTKLSGSSNMSSVMFMFTKNNMLGLVVALGGLYRTFLTSLENYRWRQSHKRFSFTGLNWLWDIVSNTATQGGSGWDI